MAKHTFWSRLVAVDRVDTGISPPAAIYMNDCLNTTATKANAHDKSPYYRRSTPSPSCSPDVAAYTAPT